MQLLLLMSAFVMDPVFEELSVKLGWFRMFWSTLFNMLLMVLACIQFKVRSKLLMILNTGEHWCNLVPMAMQDTDAIFKVAPYGHLALPYIQSMQQRGK